ncbi:hypothetical protein BJX65DRAFT_275466 [Aspergillus insuetus]
MVTRVHHRQLMGQLCTSPHLLCSLLWFYVPSPLVSRASGEAGSRNTPVFPPPFILRVFSVPDSSQSPCRTFFSPSLSLSHRHFSGARQTSLELASKLPSVSF